MTDTKIRNARFSYVAIQFFCTTVKAPHCLIAHTFAIDRRSFNHFIGSPLTEWNWSACDCLNSQDCAEISTNHTITLESAFILKLRPSFRSTGSTIPLLCSKSLGFCANSVYRAFPVGYVRSFSRPSL